MGIRSESDSDRIAAAFRSDRRQNQTVIRSEFDHDHTAQAPVGVQAMAIVRTIVDGEGTNSAWMNRARTHTKASRNVSIYKVYIY